MTTDLDRLLEGIKFHILNKMTVKGLLDSKQSWKDENILVIESPLTKRVELESLKSQIESKLAQADEITNQELATIQFRQAKTEIFELREENRNLKQELSQLRPIVQTLRKTVEVMETHGDVPKIWVKQVLKSILASSDQTYYVEMINPSGKVTLHTDNTYTTHHSECKCDKCSEVKQHGDKEIQGKVRSHT